MNLTEEMLSKIKMHLDSTEVKKFDLHIQNI